MESQIFIFSSSFSPDYQTCICHSLLVPEFRPVHLSVSSCLSFLILANGTATYEILKAKTGIVLIIILDSSYPIHCQVLLALFLP